MKQKVALITGITGQDGSYLAELLLEKGYTVHGIVRRSSSFNTIRINHLYEDDKVMGKTFFTHYGDVTDSNSLNGLVSKIQPDELYHLAAQSHVRVSFDTALYTSQVDAIGTLNVLDAIRNCSPHTKMYNAATSELWGGVPKEMPRDGYTELSNFNPRSPYACAKAYSFYITKNYREAYNMFAVSGILLNHESPRRGETFVTRKITLWFANFYKSKQKNIKIKPIELGTLDARRDWSHAKDFVLAQWLMLQHSTPEDFVIASGEAHSIREFVELCFYMKGLYIEWEGDKENEVGKCDGEIVIKINPRLFRPTEVELLIGDCSKAKKVLGWKPQYNFEQLVSDMVESDLKN